MIGTHILFAGLQKKRKSNNNNNNNNNKSKQTVLNYVLFLTLLTVPFNVGIRHC